MITALVGPDHAARDSLTQVLSARPLLPLLRTGSLKLSGVPIRRLGSFRNIIGFLPRKPLLSPQLSIKRTFKLHCMMKGVSDNEQIIARLLKMLQLSKIQNKRIGDLGRRAKGVCARVALGLQLIPMPSILVVDRPLAHLESEDARLYLKILRMLCEVNQITVICNLESIPPDCAKVIDRVVVLSQTQAVYQGFAWEPRVDLEFAGFRLPRFANPLRFMVSVVDQRMIQENFWQHKIKADASSGAKGQK